MLDNLRRQRRHGHAPTLLLIASKESTVQRADRVLLLDNGRIVDSGPHLELLRRNPAYRDLLGIEHE